MDNFDPEKRLDFRVKIDKDIQINTIIFDDKLLDLPKPMSLKVENMSCCGILISTNLDFPKNTCFCLKLDFKNSTIDIVAQIIRKDHNGEKFLYGCKFLQPAPTEQQKLRQFVFDEQIKRKRQRRE